MPSPSLDKENVAPAGWQTGAVASGKNLQDPSESFDSGKDNEAQERLYPGSQENTRPELRPSQRQRGLYNAAEDASGPSLEELQNLLSNCLKMASENKINKQNTWDLRLIDHASSLVKAGKDDNLETNFQKASCVLEAGVKIYSTRVDATHNETYRVLGGLHRTAIEEEAPGQEPGNHAEDGGDGEDQEDGRREKKRDAPSSTLETSWDAINVKSIDRALTVDPLFHMTSAQFDEGGAKGLLLNTLSVYRQYEIVFDSEDVPDEGAGTLDDKGASTTMVDLSGLQDKLQAMLQVVHGEAQISPTLASIMQLLDDPDRAAAEQAGAADGTGSSTSWGGEDAGQSDVQDDLDPGDPQQGHLGVSFLEDEEDVMQWLETGLPGMPRKSADWAGPEYWKYRAKPADGLQAEGKPFTPHPAAPKPKRARGAPFLLDFSNPPDMSAPELAPVPRKAEKEISLARAAAANAGPSTLLPDDLHYQPIFLARLFLRPDVQCLPSRSGKIGGQGDDDWDGDDATGLNNGDDDDDDHGDCNPANVGGDGGSDDEEGLVDKPRMVAKVEVNYARSSKQVDVRALKQVLWEGLQDMEAQRSQEGGMDLAQGPDRSLSFKDLLKNVPKDCPAGPVEDISIHLCFICVLHLANEHNLAIKGFKDMDELLIQNVQE